MSGLPNHNMLASGSLFLHAIGFLKSKKGEEAVEALEKSFGDLLFDQHKMYPLERLIELQEKVVSLTLGTDSREGYYMLGRYTFNAFAHSLVGATLTNVNPTPRILLGKIQEIWGSVVNFGVRKLTMVDDTQGKAIVEIQDDPRNPAYLQGIIEGGLTLLKVKNPKTVIKQEEDYRYIVEVFWTTS